METKTLILTLKKGWFDMMLVGIKKKEYRKKSKWIESRLINKEYTHVKFINGYGKDKPYFIAQYKGFETALSDYIAVYEGQPIMIEQGDYIINIGDITETNVELKNKQP